MKKHNNDDKKIKNKINTDDGINNIKNDDNKITIEQFNNKNILLRITENKLIKNKLIIKELKHIAPLLNDDDLLKIYNKSISIHQCKNQSNGIFLENDILAVFLDEQNIHYKKQTTINKSGLIVGFNEKKNKCYHIIDFVIGNNIKIDKLITEYKVISCKTTYRERWTHDDCTYTFIPKLYILLTITYDYSSSMRFRENIQRKIITCVPKKKMIEYIN